MFLDLDQMYFGSWSQFLPFLSFYGLKIHSVSCRFWPTEMLQLSCNRRLSLPEPEALNKSPPTPVKMSAVNKAYYWNIKDCAALTEVRASFFVPHCIRYFFCLQRKKKADLWWFPVCQPGNPLPPDLPLPQAVRTVFDHSIFPASRCSLTASASDSHLDILVRFFLKKPLTSQSDAILPFLSFCLAAVKLRRGLYGRLSRV